MRRTRFSTALAGAFCLVFLWACGSDDPDQKPVEKPTLADAKILSFEANSDTVVSGEKVQLTWRTEDADDIRLFAGDEPVNVAGRSPREGGVEVEVSKETTFRFVAIGPSKVEVDASVVVKVRLPGAPGIERFTAEPEEVVSGQVAVLQWKVVEAEELTITTPERAVTTSRTMDGSLNVTPSVTTTYTLTAVGPGGEATAEVTVAVAPAILRFDVTPDAVGASPEAPARVSVVWQTVGAQSVQLVAEPGGAIDITGKNPDFGQVEVEIVGDTSFTLTAEGEGAQSSQTITVSTSSVPVIASFFVPEVVGAGESFVVEWDVRNAVSVQLEKDGELVGTVPGNRLQGEHVDFLSSGGATYVLRAVGQRLTVEAEAGVRVGEPEIVSFAPSVERAEPGTTVTLQWETKGGSSLALLDPAGKVVHSVGSRAEIRSGSFDIDLPATPAQDFRGFTLQVGNSSGGAQAWAGFGVGDGPVIERFQAEPAVMAGGTTTTLTWAVGPDVDGEEPDVTLVDHDGTSHDVTGVGGRFDVTLDDPGSHTFTLEVTTSLGSMSSTLTVEVVAPPTVTLAASPATLDPATLPNQAYVQWTTTNAFQVEIFEEDDQGHRNSVTLRINSPRVDADEHPVGVTALPAKFVAVATNAFGETAEATVTITAD